LIHKKCIFEKRGTYDLTLQKLRASQRRRANFAAGVRRFRPSFTYMCKGMLLYFYKFEFMCKCFFKFFAFLILLKFYYVHCLV